MAKKQTSWTESMINTVVETVEQYRLKGKSVSYGLKKAARQLGVTPTNANFQYYNYQKNGWKSKQSKRGPYKKKTNDNKEVSVSTLKTKGSFGMGAICEFGVVTLSAELLTINFHEDTTLKIEQTKNGMTISKV